MLEAIPDGIKTATAIVSLVGVVGGASYKFIGGALEAHRVTFENEVQIEIIEDTVSLIHRETHEIMDQAKYSSCMLELQMTDSLFSPRVIEQRCPPPLE